MSEKDYGIYVRPRHNLLVSTGGSASYIFGCGQDEQIGGAIGCLDFKTRWEDAGMEGREDEARRDGGGA